MTVYICMYIYIHPCKLHLRQHLRHHVRILCVILPQICLICLWPPAMETSNHLRKCVFHGTLLELVGRVPVASMKIVSSCDWSRRPSSSHSDCLAQRRLFHDSVSCGAAAVCIACGISLSWVLKRHQVRTVSVPFWNSKGYYQTELSRKVVEKIQCSCQEISLSQTKLIINQNPLEPE